MSTMLVNKVDHFGSGDAHG